MLIHTFRADDFNSITSSIKGWLQSNTDKISVLHISHAAAVRFQSNNTIEYTCIIMYIEIKKSILPVRFDDLLNDARGLN